jgi:DivIVA domain-containing protein
VVVPHSIIASIDAVEFDRAFRGYRPDQVHAALDQIRAEVVEMSVAYGQARREAEVSRLRAQRTVEAPPPAPPSAPAANPVGEHVAALLDEARTVVAEQFRGAAERADAIVTAAERTATEVTDEARRRAEHLLLDAQREAEQTTTTAQAEREQATKAQEELNTTLHRALDAMGALRASLPARPDGSDGSDGSKGADGSDGSGGRASDASSGPEEEGPGDARPSGDGERRAQGTSDGGRWLLGGPE